VRVERVVFIVKLLSFERSTRADCAASNHFQNNMDLLVFKKKQVSVLF